MQTTTWKAIDRIPGYQMNADGEIRRLAGRLKWNGKKFYELPEAILKPCKSKNGYWVVNINRKVEYIHRLIAETLLPPSIYSGMDVNHIDGNKDNNSPMNLEWCDRKMNINHAFDIGLQQRGEKHHSAKYSNQLIKEIRERHESTKLSPTELKRIYYPDVPRTTISAIINNHRRIKK